jgi:anti-sigma B factor antagonist
MPLTWTIETLPLHTVVQVDGGLTLGPNLNRFSREVSALLSQPVILDLAHVDEIDSAGLGELVILYTAARQSNSSVSLAAAGPRVTRLLNITRLASLFPQFKTIAEASQERARRA